MAQNPELVTNHVTCPKTTLQLPAKQWSPVCILHPFGKNLFPSAATVAVVTTSLHGICTQKLTISSETLKSFYFEGELSHFQFP